MNFVQSTVLPRSFFAHDTEIVARKLLGKILVRKINNQILAGIIIETEAYTADDPACHAYRGKRIANKSLFGPVGHAYVYISYGMHFCFNTVAYAPEQQAGGVLIRALKPLEGLELMHTHRNTADIRILTNGPGKVTQALSITKQLDGHDLTQGTELFVVDRKIAVPSECISTSPRIGISKAINLHRRFYVQKSAVLDV